MVDAFAFDDARHLKSELVAKQFPDEECFPDAPASVNGDELCLARVFVFGQQFDFVFPPDDVHLSAFYLPQRYDSFSKTLPFFRQIDEILIEMAEIESLIFRQIDEKSLDLAEIRIIYNTVIQFVILFYAAKSRSEFVRNSCMVCMLEFGRNFDVVFASNPSRCFIETFLRRSDGASPF